MTQKLRVCVLQCANEESSGALKDVDPYRKPGVYDTAGEFKWHYVPISKAKVAAQLLELGTSGQYDVFLNLCDGAWDEDRAGLEVIEALERLNLPYTGADRVFYEPSKIDIKMAAQQFGVTVPAWVHINRFGPTGQQGVEKGLAAVLAAPEEGGLRFPLIVKHPSGYSSVGMTKQSKVTNEAELRQQVGLMVQQFGGALVEEFIAGREFTVLVVEEPRGGVRPENGIQTAAAAAASAASAADPHTTTNGTAAINANGHNGQSTTDRIHGGGAAALNGGGDHCHSSTDVVSEAAAAAATDADGATATGGEAVPTPLQPLAGATVPVTAAETAAAETAAAETAAVETTAAETAATPDADEEDPEADRDPDALPFRVVSYMPVECVFGPGEDFKHFQLKWHDYDSCNWRPCEEPQLAARLKDAARKTYIATRGVSYGRCDFRVDPTGQVFLLEINANCGMLYPPGQHGSGDYILTLDPQRDHMHFIRTIVHTALVRHRLRQPKVVRSLVRRPRQRPAPEAPAGGGGAAAAAAATPAGGEWGLMAVAAIREGEVVQRGEARLATLASRSWVERCWPRGSRKRTWFDSGAYPISEEVYVTRPEDPTAWTPLHHSCDPNCWLRGLDLLARRDIEPGETITVDLATLRGDALQPFDCHCGATNCRRRVTAEDWMAPWLAERYGSHVSTYVAEKRRRAGLPV